MLNHMIAMSPASDYRRDNYGVLLESDTIHTVTGAGVHNRHHGHVLEVWENRPSRANGADPAVLVDPFGRPTEDRYTVILAAKATVIAARPTGDEKADGTVIALGDHVTLTVAGFPTHTYRVQAGRMTDPVAVRIA